MAKVIPITVIIRPDGIDVNPTYVNVPNSTQDVKLRWTLVGTTFPTSGCFAWKDNPTGAPAVGCPGSAGERMLESAVYTNNDSQRRVWSYKITIVDPEDDTKTITIDPEVNNEPPGN